MRFRIDDGSKNDSNHRKQEKVGRREGQKQRQLKNVLFPLNVEMTRKKSKIHTSSIFIEVFGAFLVSIVFLLLAKLSNEYWHQYVTL